MGVAAWFFRVFNYLTMLFGFVTVSKKLAVVVHVIPRLGPLCRMMTPVPVLFLFPLFSCFVVIAVMWVFYRPF